jgi:hypothetical protein
MIAKIKTKDVKIETYPRIIQPLLRYMRTYNLSNTEMAKSMGIHRQELDKYVRYPYKIPNPKFLTALLKLFPGKDTEKSIIEHLINGKNNGNH